MIWWLVHNTLSAAILALMATLVCRWRRAHPALRHALWLVVLAKLVAPPLPVWSFAWPTSWPEPRTWVSQIWEESKFEASGATGSEQPVAFVAAETLSLPESRIPGDPESYVVLGAADDVFQAHDAKPAAAIKHAASFHSSQHRWTNFLSWSDWNGLVLRVWLAAGTGMLVYQCFRLRRFQTMLDTAAPPPDWLAREVREIAGELRIAAPDVGVVGVRCTPLVWVLGRVQLLWPESMLEGFSAESRRTIIAHELAHLARRDHWVARCEVAAAVFWWWHPLFWYVRAMLHDAAEQACDARVTHLLPSARRAYAQALVEVCELLSPAVTPGPALGVGSQTRRAFERRLTMIMREKVASRLSLGAVTGVGLLALAVLPGFTPAQDNPPLPATAPAIAVKELDVAKAPPAAAEAPTALPAPLPPDIPGKPGPVTDPAFGSTPPAPTANPVRATEPAAHAIGVQPLPPGFPGAPMYPGGLGSYKATPADPTGTGADEVVHLTRATYRLPAELAQPFAAFLNQTLAEAVQAQVQVTQSPLTEPTPTGAGMASAQVHSKLIVTADEEAQRIVGHFIGLLRIHGKAPVQDVPMMSAGWTTMPPSVKYDEPAAETPRFAPGYPVQAMDENGQVKYPNMDRYQPAVGVAQPGVPSNDPFADDVPGVEFATPAAEAPPILDNDTPRTGPATN